ncbi:MAG: DUF1501 domain-containing protein [Candidatus Solibacter usitatus]|nr:DUF1501 domain-containing protein [Candidatus Solibacter usitatus]
MKMRTVEDVVQSRRDLLKLGGLGILAASADAVWPLQLGASQSKVTPRGTARNVLFYEISGAISHVESFDFKDSAGCPKDLDVRKVPGFSGGDLYLPHLLFPKLEKHIDKFAIYRAMLSHEEVHFRGQYYQQTGRQLNLAFAREIPSLGSVIAMELEQRRREHDTFPAYMSFHLEKGAAGALSTGFLPPRFSVVDINPEAAVKGNALEKKALDLMEERWRLLRALHEAERPLVSKMGKEMAGYDDFYTTAHRLLSDERWPAAFQISDQDRKRYGNHSVGISAILARNVLAQDAGTHYIHLCHPGWDHHVQIWDRKASSNHYTLCSELDPTLSSLMEDLSTTRSRTDPSKTLLDETLVVVMSEFGRTPGALNNMAGRDHYNRCYPVLFAGAGVKGGRILARTDKDGAKCLDTGWNHKEQPRMENVAATMFSALGIDWSKEIKNTPSGRAYTYVDPLGPSGYIPTDEIAPIYG